MNELFTFSKKLFFSTNVFPEFYYCKKLFLSQNVHQKSIKIKKKEWTKTFRKIFRRRHRRRRRRFSVASISDPWLSPDGFGSAGDGMQPHFRRRAQFAEY